MVRDETFLLVRWRLGTMIALAESERLLLYRILLRATTVAA